MRQREKELPHQITGGETIPDPFDMEVEPAIMSGESTLQTQTADINMDVVRMNDYPSDNESIRSYDAQRTSAFQ